MIESIKAALVAALSKQAYAALLAIPGFGWIFAIPVFSHLTQFIINKAISWQVQKTAVGLSVLWIMVEMQYGIKTAVDARIKLRDMIDNPDKYNETQQKEIMEYFDEATIDLIQLSLKRL